MGDKNTFLDSYKNKAQQQGDNHQQENPNVQTQKNDMDYNAYSGFIKPEKKSTQAVYLPRKKTKNIVMVTSISAVVLICIIIGTYFLLNQGVEVVDFTGWTESNAQIWARDKGVILQIEQTYNDDFEAGKVVSQNVASGSKIKRGDFIKLTVSLGHDLSVRLPLPNIMSMTRKEIETWAAENYMTKVRIATEHSDEVEAGRVIRYEINDDTVIDEVRRDTPIYIIISKGPEDKTAATVTVPDFKQMPIPECYIFANENGIILTVEEQYDDYVPAGAIISQSIKPNEKISKGTEIVLTVSKGKLITVPNFSGFSKEKATAMASELGIAVAIKERYSSYPAGRFISQSIKAGSEYKAGDILELHYSIGNEIIAPSFVGQTRVAIESWAKELNEQGAVINIKTINTPSNFPKGTIIHQDKANMVIGVKTTISITVSTGKIIFVPDFVAPQGSGYDTAITREKAIAMCEELNIVPIFEKAAKSGRLPGEIWAQSIPAGTEVTEGTTITLKYVPVDVRIKVPNFINMTKEEILAGNYYKILDIRFVEGADYVDDYGDRVCKQSLAAGTETAAGSIITLTICTVQPD